MPDPAPVYLVYLTAAPRPEGGIALQKDVYNRDAPLMAAMSERLAATRVLTASVDPQR